MARPGITYLDVAQAATKLHEQNIRPSIEGIRRVLGTGSNSTINRHLRDWRDKQGNQLELEQGLPETLLIAVKGLYESIKEDAEQKINSNKSAANQAIHDIQGQLAESEKSNRALFQKNQSLESALSEAQAEKQALNNRLNDIQRQLEKVSDKVSLQQSRLQDKDDAIKQLTNQLTHVQANLDHYRDSVRQEREAELARHQAQVAQLESELREQINQTSKRQTEVSQLSAQIQTLEQTKTTNLMQIAEIEHQLKESESRASVYQEQLKSLEEKYAAAHEQSHLMAKEAKSSGAECNSLKMAIERTVGKLESTEIALKKAEDNVANLSNKNLFLAQENAELKAQLKERQERESA